MATHSSTLSDTDTIWNVEFENRRFANSGLLLLNESLCIIKSNALACDLHNMKTLINSYFLDCIVKPLRSQFLKEITSLQTVLGEGSSQKLQFRVLSSRDGLSISGGTQVNILMKIHKVLINQASFYFIYEIQSSPGRALTASPHFSPEISECTQVESIGLFMEGLRHSPHMALIVSKYDCLMANQAFYKTLGYKEDDVFNMNLFDFLDLSNKALFKKYYDHVVCLRKSENILPYRLHLTTKFGRKIPCLVHFKQIATRESESAVVFYFTNLSAQLLSERKFKQEKKEREGLLLEKGRHLQTINHEVRNCMNFVPSSLEVMVARINALQGQGIAPSLLEKLKSEAVMVKQAVDDSLDLLELEMRRFKNNGKLRLNPQPSSLTRMLTHFIEGVQAKIRMDSEGDTSSRITFFPNISKDVREVIRHQKFLFDPLYLRLVFVNFFNNSYHSIKKNGVGVIAFDVELEHSKADALTLSFKISDNGPGFDRSFDNLGYDEVFKGRERQKIERNGAGVARSHAVLAKMKSKLFFSSTKGEGASASFSMTFRKSKEKNPAQFSLRPAAGLYPLVEKAVKSAFRALVVDDQAINAKLIVRSFKNMNYSCDMASGGEEAIALCKKHSYQLIFMDYQMPGLNGLQTAERILCDQEGKNQETSIYGLSGNYDLELEQECLSKGMKGLLSKPLKPSVFRQIVAKITKVAELSPSISPFLEQVGVQRLPKLPSFSEEERKESPFPQFVGNRYAIPNFPNKRGMLPPGVVAPRAKKPSISFLPNTTQFPSYSDSPIPSQSEQKDFNSPPSLLDEKKKERKKAPNPCCTVQ